ncbi:MAG: RNA polymerase sigma factor [Jatrophihabitans sp.]|nr:MAG: RNA polymerase sigma factor [Jatrophihabitans sp.]
MPTDPPSSDDALDLDLCAVQAGDEAAFGRLFRAVQPGLVRYLSALVGSDAPDVAGETWLQVCRDLARFSGDVDGFRGWVARIGRNRALDHARTARRRPETAALDDLLTLPAADTTDDLALQRLTTEAAVAAIAALPRDQAEAVLLRVVMGLDATAAARVLGKRPGAVRTAAHRGLRSLQRRLSAAPTAAEAGCNTYGVVNADEVR